jgi:predicted  nucleic acid-binding Zn-ribbon protein
MDYPAAWIVTVREENFGPLRDNEDLRALREDMAKLERDRVVLDDSVKAIVANQTKLNARIDDLLRRAKEIAA